MDSCKHLNGASFRPVYAVKSCAKLVTTRVNNTVTKSWRTICVNPFPFVCVHLLQGLNDSAKECWGCLHGGMKILEGETCNFSLGLHAVIITFQQNYHNNQLVVTTNEISGGPVLPWYAIFVWFVPSTSRIFPLKAVCKVPGSSYLSAKKILLLTKEDPSAGEEYNLLHQCKQNKDKIIKMAPWWSAIWDPPGARIFLPP